MPKLPADPGVAEFDALQGDPARTDALFDGYHGRPFDRSGRESLLRLLLLHRCSNLQAQIARPGWQAAPDFAAPAALIWP